MLPIGPWTPRPPQAGPGIRTGPGAQPGSWTEALTGLVALAWPRAQARPGACAGSLAKPRA